MRKTHNRGAVLVIRRYRRLRNGKILDAHDYGYKGWPMWIRKKS